MNTSRDAAPSGRRDHLAGQTLLVLGHGQVQPRWLAARWRGWRDRTTAPELEPACHHGGALHVEWDEPAMRCGKPWADHAWCGATLVCPGDWLVTGAGQVRAVKPHLFHTLYEPLP